MVKDRAIQLINSLPDDCTLEDIQYHLFVREKIEHGLKAVDEGLLITQEEAEDKVKAWLKSFGRNRP